MVPPICLSSSIMKSLVTLFKMAIQRIVRTESYRLNTILFTKKQDMKPMPIVI